MGVEIVSAETLERPSLAALFTAAYEGYAVPLRVDEKALAFMIDAYDLDVASSRVALRGADPVGLALLGVRGRAGWVGGMGRRRRRAPPRDRDAPDGGAPGRGARRRRRRGRPGGARAERPAIALYERLGFRRPRMLEVWSLAAEAEPREASPIPLDEALRWIRRNRCAPEPWQRADETLARLRGRSPEPEALGVADDGAVVFRVADGRVSALQLAAHDADAAAALLAAARGRGGALHFVNVPAGDPASAALRRLGGSLDIRQLEMSLSV